MNEANEVIIHLTKRLEQKNEIIDRLQRQLSEATHALTFYSQENNWRSPEQVNADEQFDTAMSFNNDRHGQRARMALKYIHSCLLTPQAKMSYGEA